MHTRTYVHYTTGSVDLPETKRIQKSVEARATHLAGLFFLMRHFGGEYLDDLCYTDLCEGLRSVGDLGEKISQDFFSEEEVTQ